MVKSADGIVALIEFSNPAKAIPARLRPGGGRRPAAVGASRVRGRVVGVDAALPRETGNGSLGRLSVGVSVPRLGDMWAKAGTLSEKVVFVRLVQTRRVHTALCHG
jgi:hypothetical protein